MSMDFEYEFQNSDDINEKAPYCKNVGKDEDNQSNVCMFDTEKPFLRGQVDDECNYTKYPDGHATCKGKPLPRNEVVAPGVRMFRPPMQSLTGTPSPEQKEAMRKGRERFFEQPAVSTIPTGTGGNLDNTVQYLILTAIVRLA